jgi:hypothetical protein
VNIGVDVGLANGVIVATGLAPPGVKPGMGVIPAVSASPRVTFDPGLRPVAGPGFKFGLTPLGLVAGLFGAF